MRLSKRGGTINWNTSHKVSEPDRYSMKQEEFQELCTALKIEDALTASRCFGLHWRTCQRYWFGELSVPGPLARLLRLAVAHKVAHKDLR